MRHRNNISQKQESKGQAAKLILIIEQSESVAMVYKSILLQDEYTIFTATSGQDALAIMGSFKPDLIITTEELPDMDSDHLRRQISIQNSETYLPILVLTVEKTPRFLSPSSTMTANLNETFFLPFRIRDLRTRVQQLLGEQEQSHWNFYYPSNPEKFRTLPSKAEAGQNFSGRRYQGQAIGAQVGAESYA